MGDRWADSSSSSFQCSWDYDVFLSFKGEDTRRNFIGHLLHAFRRRGIHVFMDDEVIRGSEEISQAVVKGIEQSRISIVIFSENHASSALCLTELETILECRKTKGQLVMPVFYYVDPSDVRCQRASFAEAMAKHELRFKADSERVQRWRLALQEAANFSGWRVDRFRNEFECIAEITEVVIGLIGGLKSLNAKAENLRPNISKWKRDRLLGCGSFGSVYEAINDEEGCYFAVREASLLDHGTQGNQIVYLEKEIALLSQFEHKNIVKYYGTKRDQSNLYVFLELATQGSLASLCRTYTFKDPVVSRYTRQILQGLKYLHDRNVIHRDIKGANILVDADGSVKITDFGFAMIIKSNETESFKGTPLWMAPEVICRTNEGYGLPADIWSLGCTVLEMLTGRAPYSDFETWVALSKIKKGELPTLPEKLSSDARNFILQCLQVNPNDRPTAAELLNHSFVNG